MILKERQNEPTYVWKAKADFAMLLDKHNYYASSFIGHPIFPSENYQKELQRIKDEWKNKDSMGAHRSEAKDLENLYISYDQVRLNQILQVSILNQMFGQVYSYYFDMLNDNNIGYLSDENFAKYLEDYNSAINRNKELKLDCYNKEPFNQIERKISELILKHKNYQG